MSATIEKAQLRELDSSFTEEINQGRWVMVQFNPESLKVAFANALQQSQGGSDQGGGAAQQFVGSGSTKLAVTLWFDVSSDIETEEDDVRRLTAKVAYFITPQEVQGTPKKFLPPIVRFLWGTFQFDGMVESMEETLEFFSPDGKPLRASVTLSITAQKIRFDFAQPTANGNNGNPGPGTAPLTQPPPGESIQQMNSRNGGGTDWQPVAQANDVDNPRFPTRGQALDMNRRS